MSAYCDGRVQHKNNITSAHSIVQTYKNYMVHGYTVFENIVSHGGCTDCTDCTGCTGQSRCTEQPEWHPRVAQGGRVAGEWRRRNGRRVN